MKTYIYMIRHCESPKNDRNERNRGLTEKGKKDASKLTELLKDEELEVFISSTFKRAILTIDELANIGNKSILLYENLKECSLSKDEITISDKEAYPVLEKMFINPTFCSPG